jgi:carboxyl-terminal processing protease
MKMYRVIAWLGVAVLSFSVGFISDLSDDYLEISKNLDIFGHLYREVNTLYVDDTDPGELMRTGIDAMLSSLDPYTTFYGEEDLEDFQFMSTGQYGGIGALVGKREDAIVILQPYEGYPADRAGLKAGDQIVQVGDTEVDGEAMEVLDVRNLLRGNKGTAVNLQVKRPGVPNPLSLLIERDRITVDNVPYYGMVDDEVGYIALTGFTQDAAKEVQTATVALKRQHPNLKGLVLDLRNNPGGRLDESIKIANIFVEQRKLIVETKGRIEGSQQSYYAKRSAVDAHLPLAVLVNDRSASASEIVAGAIQDLDRGVIVGQRSFGKGLVQNIRPLAYRTQLKVTTAKYYTPSGRCIQAIDYAERNADGSVSRIPDSLRNVFSTRNGRPVLDGGGIGPDVEVEKADLPLVARALSVQGLIFAFVNQFTQDHERIAAPRDFQISEGVYREFVAFVRSEDFSYQTPADRELAQLKETVAEEAYAELLKSNLEDLESTLATQKTGDLMKHRAAISRLLREEILTRYYYQRGAIEGMLVADPEVETAVDLLRNGQRYEKILSGEEK